MLAFSYHNDIINQAEYFEFFMTCRELEKAEPFTRTIHEDELWLYRNPRTDSFVPTTILWVYIFIDKISHVVDNAY